MKILLTTLMLLIPFVFQAQDHQTIVGNLVEDVTFHEEMDSIVVSANSPKIRNLTKKGVKFPGGTIFYSPKNFEKELGSIVETKHKFLVKTISFTVESNSIEGCKANIGIYRMCREDSLVNIVTIPIHQQLPTTKTEQTFTIVPQENIILERGQYFVSFSIIEIGKEIAQKWKEWEKWDEKEYFSHYQKDRIKFPLYMKTSYSRDTKDTPLTKRKVNIGMSVKGIRMKE